MCRLHAVATALRPAARTCNRFRATTRCLSSAPTATGPLLVGLDSGTQSIKACVFDTSGSILASSSAPQAVSSPADGLAEQDIADWRRGLFAAIRGALADVGPSDRRGPCPEVAAIGLSFQRESFTLVSAPQSAPAAGEPLTPLRDAILWLDGRADSKVEELRAGSAEPELSADLYHQLTGKPLDVTSALARMQWLAEHEPAITRADFRFVDCGAVLCHALTDELVTCVAGADTCGLIDLHTREWSVPVMTAAGLTQTQLPRLAEPGEVIGHVTAAAAAELGGAIAEGCPVVVAGGDGQVFNVGMAAEGVGGDGMMLTLGTSVVLSLNSATPAISPAYRTLAAAEPGSDGAHAYTCESVVQSGTLILKWFMDEFGADDFSHWEREASVLPPGSEGLVTVPHFWCARQGSIAPSRVLQMARALIQWHCGWQGLPVPRQPPIAPRRDPRMVASAWEGPPLPLRD